MSVKKALVLVIILITTAFLATGCSGRNAEFGYIDMQKLMQESTKLKEYNEQIDKKVKENQEIDEKEKASLSEEVFLQNQRVRQAEIMAFGRELEEEFMADFNKASNDIANEKKLGAILLKSSVLQGGVDITEDMIKKMN